MSRFLSDGAAKIAPYVPGEQPQDKSYIKLNTNECPYGPSLLVKDAIGRFQADSLRLYPDPDAGRLKEAAARAYGLAPEQVFAAGGSDEALAYAFMAFFDRGDPVAYPDITYGFYRVYADLFRLESREIPLTEDYAIDIEAYRDVAGHLFIANPNAPTGLLLPTDAIEALLRQNPDRLVVVDEAYIDFAEQPSCVSLVEQYDNLLVVQTFSKSRALAGMRLGFAFGSAPLIEGLERIKYSFNPYNLDRLSIEVGIAALADRQYVETIAGRIRKTRDWTTKQLESLGFQVLPSASNFLFARLPGREGAALYGALKDRGILVRHFPKPRISEFLRITIGTDEEMRTLLQNVTELLR
ncbi:histidinol-phosphate transaminase [Ruminococcaceae bacterium OttesenSCG-928-L11]|nr:histidinol-phosphate transaminase [Ruminococcaceae bacterium OttesenSCG-928-L11]